MNCRVMTPLGSKHVAMQNTFHETEFCLTDVLYFILFYFNANDLTQWDDSERVLTLILKF